jgi:Protein of unknown function, DUF547
VTPAGVLVAWRERALNRLAGVRPDDVLNAPPSSAAVGDALRVALDLKRAVNNLLATAGSSSGDSLDYPRLAESGAYGEYRTVSASALWTLDLATLSSREARLAFWIDVYNALVIDAVIAFGVRRSVGEGRLGYLTFFRKAAYLVGGHRLSCDDIEHGILRGNRGHPFIPGPQFGPNDPRLALVIRPPDVRVHFALNCASRSCPPIGAYEAEQIDRQLDLAARSFVAGDMEVEPSRDIARVSRIFRWFADDFGGREGVLAILRRYLPDDERRRWLEAQGGRVRLKYRPYDWRLNAAA